MEATASGEVESDNTGLAKITFQVLCFCKWNVVQSVVM